MVKRAETRSDAGRRLPAGSPLPQPGEHVGGIGFEAGAETLRREFFCDGDRAGRGIECVECRFSGIGLDLMFAQAGERRLGFRKRARENRGGLDPSSPRDSNCLSRPCDPPPTLKLREPHLLLQDMAPQLCDLGGKKGASSQRSIAFGLEGRDGRRGLCREVVAFGRDGGNGTRLGILDPGASRVQPLALLALLRDGDRQRLLSSVERSGTRICWSRIARAF